MLCVFLVLLYAVNTLKCWKWSLKPYNILRKKNICMFINSYSDILSFNLINFIKWEYLAVYKFGKHILKEENYLSNTVIFLNKLS